MQPLDGSQFPLEQSELDLQDGKYWHCPLDALHEPVFPDGQEHVLGVFTQLPVVGSQESTVHALPSSQFLSLNWQAPEDLSQAGVTHKLLDWHLGKF